MMPGSSWPSSASFSSTASDVDGCALRRLGDDRQLEFVEEDGADLLRRAHVEAMPGDAVGALFEFGAALRELRLWAFSSSLSMRTPVRSMRESTGTSGISISR
jgi:hypothetical protein